MVNVRVTYIVKQRVWKIIFFMPIPHHPHLTTFISTEDLYSILIRAVKTDSLLQHLTNKLFTHTFSQWVTTSLCKICQVYRIKESHNLLFKSYMENEILKNACIINQTTNKIQELRTTFSRFIENCSILVHISAVGRLEFFKERV